MLTPSAEAALTRATLSLGSNLTVDRGALLRAALRLLQDRGVRVLRRSPILETDPVGGPFGQGPYLNQVVTVVTELDAAGLLAVCHEIEAALGRRRRVRWGPRTIDIDILTFGSERHSTPELTIPHPAITERPFTAAGLSAVRGPLPR